MQKAKLGSVLADQRNKEREAWRQGDKLERANEEVNSMLKKIENQPAKSSIQKSLALSTQGQEEGGAMVSAVSILVTEPDMSAQKSDKKSSGMKEYRD